MVGRRDSATVGQSDGWRLTGTAAPRAAALQRRAGGLAVAGEMAGLK
jgi:hypothetical protein